MESKDTPRGATVPAELLPPEQGGSLVTTGSGALSTAQLKEMEVAVAQRVELLDRIKSLIDQRVDAGCFDRFEDNDGKIKVRRNKNYADIVGATIGATFRYLKDERGHPLFTRINYQDDEGPYYVYECFGVASLPGMVEIECSGAASSRDKFLSRGQRLSVSEVDERFVRQMAATECRKKGILSLLGLSGDGTEGEMSRVGKDARGFAGNKFQAGAQGGKTDDGAQADMRGDIKRMCQGLLAAGWHKEGSAEPTTIDAVCQQITENPPKFGGWRVIDRISEKGLKITHDQVTKVFNATCGAQSEPPPPQEAPPPEVDADGFPVEEPPY